MACATPDRCNLKGAMGRSKRFTVVIAALFLLVTAGLAQRFYRSPFRDQEGPQPVFPTGAEFHFIRLEYTDLPEHHRGWGFASRGANAEGWWVMDWPDADNHFTLGIGRLTRLDTGDPRHFRITDNQLFDNPWVYATQAGWWDLSQAETSRLREYLLRGGFLVVDDFWGEEAWDVFRRTMDRVLPGTPIVDLAQSDAVMHVLYDIQEKDRTFIPGTRHLRVGPDGSVVVQQPPGSVPAWRAMFDDRDRMVVAANYNTDVGDAWEWADSPYYPEPMTALAYRYGINYIIYSMTH